MENARDDVDHHDSQASGQRLAETIDDQVLQCSVCLDSLKEPKVLPCQHTFCKRCLEDIVERQTDKSSLECPDCRRQVRLPDNGVAGLTPNVLVNRLLDVLMKLKLVPEKCGLCDEDEDEEECLAVARCEKCNLFLCRLHYEAHRRSKESKKHTVTPLAHAGSGMKSPSSPWLGPGQSTSKFSFTDGSHAGDEKSRVAVEEPQQRVELGVQCPVNADHVALRFCQTCEELVCSRCSPNDDHTHSTHR